MADPKLIEVFSQTGKKLLKLNEGECIRKELQEGNLRRRGRNTKKKHYDGTIKVEITVVWMNQGESMGWSGQATEILERINEDDAKKVAEEWGKALRASGLPLFEKVESVLLPSTTTLEEQEYENRNDEDARIFAQLDRNIDSYFLVSWQEWLYNWVLTTKSDNIFVYPYHVVRKL